MAAIRLILRLISYITHLLSPSQIDMSLQLHSNFSGFEFVVVVLGE